jgi:hypothetical protein
VNNILIAAGEWIYAAENYFEKKPNCNKKQL